MAIIPKYDFSSESAIKDSLFSEISSIFNYNEKAKGLTGAGKEVKEKISLSDMASQFLGSRHVSKPDSKGINKAGALGEAGETKAPADEAKSKPGGGMRKR